MAQESLISPSEKLQGYTRLNKFEFARGRFGISLFMPKYERTNLMKGSNPTASARLHR
jgi:hypothetical protein